MPTTKTKDVAVQAPSGGALHVASDQHDWSQGQVAVLRQLGLEEASPEDLRVLLHMAQRTGLDPFARQIYMIGRWSRNGTKYTIQTGIDGFRVIADRSGKYQGQTGPEWCGPDGKWLDVWLGQDTPAAARVGILRSDFTEPIYAVAVFAEYAQTDRQGALTAMWKSKASIMIAKCAEALALRKAFPQDLSGIYTAEEMSQADQAAAAASPVVDQVKLPEDFDALVIDAEAKGDIETLRDLYQVASAAHRQDAMASVTAAARRVPAPQAVAESEVVDAEVLPDDDEQVPA